MAVSRWFACSTARVDVQQVNSARVPHAVSVTSSTYPWVSWFVVQVPRQRLIQVDLLDKLPLGTDDLHVPAEGMTVPHIRCAGQAQDVRSCAELLTRCPGI